MFIQILQILALSVALAKLPNATEALDSAKKPVSTKSASLYEDCVKGIKASRPGLNAEEICGRVFESGSKEKKSKHDTLAGRTMEDCMALMRQFSVPVEVGSSLCGKIVSAENKTPVNKEQQRLETESKSLTPVEL